LDENELERRVARALEAVEKTYKWNWPSASFQVPSIRWLIVNMALQVAENRSVNRQSRANPFTQIFLFLGACKKKLQSLLSIKDSFTTTYCQKFSEDKNKFW
jgi:hypothetical protein